MNGNRWGFPDLGIGVGLRTAHFATILSEWPAVDWFEAITENFLDTGGARSTCSTGSRRATRSCCTACRSRSAARTRSTADTSRR